MYGWYSSGGAAKAAVQEQIFCTNAGNDGSCAASGIERIVVQSVNGPSIETSGVDVFVNYILDSSVGQFTFGAEGELAFVIPSVKSSRKGQLLNVLSHLLQMNMVYD